MGGYIVKNKVVIYILIAYFILLTIVLITQIPKKDEPVNEPIVTELKYEEKLKNAVVFYIGSPLAVINEEQILIDENDASLVPEIIDGNTYVPARVLRTAFGASVDRNVQTAETTVRYNNKAIVFTDEKKEIKIADNNSEVTKEINAAPVILHDCIYVPLKVIADDLNKEIFFYNNLVVVSDIKDIFSPETEGDKLALLTEQVNSLPNIGAIDKLKQLIGGKNNIQSLFGANNSQNDASVNDEANKAVDFSLLNENQLGNTSDADIIKSNGEYIFYINNDAVEIISAENAEKMEISSEITFEKGFTPCKLLLKDKKLMVMGNYADEEETDIHNKFSKVYIYDITDTKNPALERQLYTDGEYFNARLNDKYLYFLATVDAASLYDGKTYYPVSYYDSCVEDKRNEEEFSNIKYFPDMTSKNYTTVISVDIEDKEKAADIKTFLGSGEDIYISQDSIYFLCRKAVEDIYSENKLETNIYKFSLENGRINYTKRANVNGALYNKYSMQENNGYFSLATSRTNNNTVSNNVYVFDSKLEKCGLIENVALGTKINSARFIGDKVYMLTFNTSDPVYVVDLKDPTKLQNLGQINLPSYSNFLKYYDENHILAFGKEVTEIEGKAYYKGLKLSMLDVTDFRNPKTIFTQSIGNKGTDSIALKDPKAFMIDSTDGKIIFPINLYTLKENANELDYGEFAFEGLKAYSFNSDEGFKELCNISHLAGSEYDEKAEIKRCLYMNDAIYALSEEKITASSLGGEKLGELIFTPKADTEAEEESSTLESVTQ